MHLISFLRSAVTGPRRGLITALAILTVIFGVVTMHSMSGSPASHGHAVPRDAAAISTCHTGAAQATTGPVLHQAPDDHAAGQGPCCAACGGHDAAMAMCLMVLVALLALVAPVRGLLWQAPPALATSLTPVLAVVRDLAAPSLHDLCISRT